jgi:hypothetical protein
MEPDMTPQGWFRKDKGPPARSGRKGGPALPGLPDAARIAAKLRPHELVAMLTHHYARVRARSLPRVSITIAVRNPAGKQAVVIACK